MSLHEELDRLTVEELKWKTPVVVAEFVLAWIIVVYTTQSSHIQQGQLVSESSLPVEVLLFGVFGLFTVVALLTGAAAIHASSVEEDAEKARGYRRRGIHMLSTGIAVVLGMLSSIVFF